ncbi:MAG: phosphatidylserine decarboxylase family protein [Cyclobacteriaceae bacterium]|nr:phosphatidylserine decarboxylase family protein [Cyclobacteriaceae bacterium]
MTIHKEGRALLLGLLIVLTGIVALVWYFLTQIWFLISAAVALVLFCLVLQFFRNPRIKINYGTKNVLAPADGKVVVVEETEENEHFKDRRIQVSIFMSPLNVHVNRSPLEGEVSKFAYHPGKYLVAWHPKSSTENERTTMVLKTTNNTELLVRQIAGAVARRIKWYVKEGDQLGQGAEYGFIKFGSRLDVFLPLDAKVIVKPGDKTKAGRTVIAELS